MVSNKHRIKDFYRDNAEFEQRSRELQEATLALKEAMYGPRGYYHKGASQRKASAVSIAPISEDCSCKAYWFHAEGRIEIFLCGLHYDGGSKGVGAA